MNENNVQTTERWMANGNINDVNWWKLICEKYIKKIRFIFCAFKSDKTRPVVKRVFTFPMHINYFYGSLIFRSFGRDWFSVDGRSGTGSISMMKLLFLCFAMTLNGVMATGALWEYWCLNATHPSSQRHDGVQHQSQRNLLQGSLWGNSQTALAQQQTIKLFERQKSTSKGERPLNDLWLLGALKVPSLSHSIEFAGVCRYTGKRRGWFSLVHIKIFVSMMCNTLDNNELERTHTSTLVQITRFGFDVNVNVNANSRCD